MKTTPVVTEPAVGGDQHRRVSEDTAKLGDQLHGLLELAAKDQWLATQPQLGVLQALAAQIKSEGQRQAAPAPVDFIEQPHGEEAPYGDTHLSAMPQSGGLGWVS